MFGRPFGRRGVRAARPRQSGPRFEPLERREPLATFHVAVSGRAGAVGSAVDPFATIQRGLDAARPGDSVLVHAGTFRERVTFPRSGSAASGPITLAAFPGERPLIDAAGVPGDDENVVTMSDVSHVACVGFEIVGNTAKDGGAAIFVSGAGTAITIRGNRLHDLRGENSMAIAVFGTRGVPLSGVVVAGNEVYDAKPAPSEAIAINGNVTAFSVVNNHVHDVNNIGIDLIGGERDVHATAVARGGVVRGNVVERARASYGGGYAAGIYVDGGRNIVVEGNVCRGNDLGIEVGAENRGFDATGIVVRNNVVTANEKAGIVFGGYAASVGRTRNSFFLHNTIVGNDTLGTGHGQVWLQYASWNLVSGNIVVARPGGTLVSADVATVGNRLDSNLYHAVGGGRFSWNGRVYASRLAFTQQTGQDRSSRFANPGFVSAGDYRLLASSVAIDAGAASTQGLVPRDFDGTLRPRGRAADLGAFECR